MCIRTQLREPKNNAWRLYLFSSMNKTSQTSKKLLSKIHRPRQDVQSILDCTRKWPKRHRMRTLRKKSPGQVEWNGGSSIHGHCIVVLDTSNISKLHCPALRVHTVYCTALENYYIWSGSTEHILVVLIRVVLTLIHMSAFCLLPVCSLESTVYGWLLAIYQQCLDSF